MQDGAVPTVNAQEVYPAVVWTATDARGPPVAITSAAVNAPTRGQVVTTTNAEGSTFLTTYTPGGGRISSVRIITTTDAQGRLQTLTGITYFDPTDGANDDERATSSATPTTLSGSTTATPIMSPSSALSTAAVAGVSVGATLAVVALAAGAYVFWRRRRRTKQTPIAVGASDETPEKGNAYTKAETHASERALYDMDGRSVVPEVDGVERLANGELEDSHASSVAREREKRGELPVQ